MSDPNTTAAGRPSQAPRKAGTMRALATGIQRASPHLKDAPAERVEAKVRSTVWGGIIAAFGMLVTGGGLYLLVVIEPFTPWLLLVPGAGMFIVLVGGITISKDVMKSFKDAAGVVRELARAARGQNGPAA